MPFVPKLEIWNYVDEWSRPNAKKNYDLVYGYKFLSWFMPSVNTFKLNIDCTRNSHNSKIGSGGVIDSKGSWISGLQINLDIGENLDAEAWGLFYGLMVASDMHIRNLVVESDPAVLVQLMQKSDLFTHPLGSIIKGFEPHGGHGS
ncbi:hypothetical protein ACLB2K_013239 [Fragaria x ananassa]